MYCQALKKYSSKPILTLLIQLVTIELVVCAKNRTNLNNIYTNENNFHFY